MTARVPGSSRQKVTRNDRVTERWANHRLNEGIEFCDGEGLPVTEKSISNTNVTGTKVMTVIHSRIRSMERGDPKFTTLQL